MKAYHIINTEIKDLPFIYSLFEEAISYQKRKGYPVWVGYDKEVLKREIENKQQYKIVIDDAIACIFSICYSDEIIWRERENGESLYLHRIAVNPFYKGQKHFGKILNWCVGYAIENALLNIRMDTWADNPDLVNYYKNSGFQIVGTLTTPDSEKLPIPQRNNRVVLLEFTIDNNSLIRDETGSGIYTAPGEN
ncbi:MAG: GNAT family N-acetyltransferase [Ginsengibacter sp.]